MKILLISDSHFKSVTKLDLSKFDYILHAGDISRNDIDFLDLEPHSYCVKGNCDFDSNRELENYITIDSKTFFLTHSHLYGSKEGYSRLISKGKSLEVDYVVFGHTHLPTAFYEGDTLFINPGSFMEGSYMVIEGDKLYQYQKKSLWTKAETYKKTLVCKLKKPF